MSIMDCEVDDVVVVESPETPSKSFKSSETEMKRIVISEDAKKRAKKLLEKAMFREKKKKLLKGYEILDCHIVEMNDSNDFSHQSKVLRTERVNRKPKTHALPIPSTSSVSEDDAHSIGPSTSKRLKDNVSSHAGGKEGVSLAQSEQDKSQGSKKCRLCCKEFADTALKDHMISCMKQTYERDVNGIQKENLENKPCCVEEVTNCHICGKDLSILSKAKRASHINTCLDQEEDEKKQREEHEKQLQEAQSVILNCPVCQKKFRTALSRTKHLKKCALSHKMSVEEIKNLAKQQQEEHKKQLDAGILPENTKASLLKNTKGKTKAKRRICEEDEDLQLAIALSISIAEEKEKLQQASSLHSASNSKSTNLLLNLSKNQAEERISKRAATLIFNATPPEGSVSQTPAFKRRKQDADSHELNKFWDKTSLASPSKSASSLTLLAEEEHSELQTSTSAPYSISSIPRDNYYVPVLMPPVTVDNSNVGSKLKPVSAIPGRQRSMDGQGRQREEEALAQEVLSESNPEVESMQQVEVQSQTVANLAELAAENEAADSQSSDGCSSPLLLSPDVNELMEEDELSGVASHQPEVDSCELKKLSSSFLSLVNCAKHSDVQIATRHGELVPAHKVVLLARCPRLYEMCDGGVIDFSGHSKESVLTVLKYVYGGEISVMVDSAEDVIKLSLSLDLPLLLEKAEGVWNIKEKPSSLNKEKTDSVCLDEDQSLNSVDEKGEEENADKASCEEEDVQTTNQPLGGLDETGDHMEGVRQLECSVENDLRDTYQHSEMPVGVYETYFKDKQIEDLNELTAQKSTDNAPSPITNQAVDGQQMDISVDERDKQSKTDKTVSYTNSPVCKVPPACPESLSTTESVVDAKSQRDKNSSEDEDDDCRISAIKLKNPQGREGMLNLVASWKKCLADATGPSLIPKVESVEVHSFGDVVPPINEYSDTVVDPVPNAEIQSAFQSVSGQQSMAEKQFDKDRMFAQFNEPLQLPDSNMALPLSSNTVPSDKNAVETLSVPVQVLSNTSMDDRSIQGLNESLLQTTSSLPLVTNIGKKSKARSKKVSAKEFKDLVSKAADGSLTDKDFEKITIKIEQENSFFGKDVYIPSVLDDANPSSPSELEITNCFIPPKRFKSKTRINRQKCQDKDKKEAELPVTKSPNLSNPHFTHVSSNPLPSLPATKTSFCGLNDNLRRDICPLESKLSTSHNSNSDLFNSDDDLFDDIEGGKDEKLTTQSAGGVASVSISSVMGSSVGCLTKTPSAELERDKKANPRKMHKLGKSIHLNSIDNAQDIHLQGTQLSTDSQTMQRELAQAIAADIQTIRSAEELSQSEDIKNDIETSLFRQSTHPLSANPGYAESTPGSNSHQGNQQSRQEEFPNNITPIKKPSASDSPNLGNNVSSSEKKKTQRGLARLKKNKQSSSPSNSPNIQATNCSAVTTFSDSYCCGSRKEKDDSGNGWHGVEKNTLSSSDKCAVDGVSGVLDKQLEDCRRNLNFGGGTTKEINKPHSRFPSSSSGVNKKLSLSSTMQSSAVTVSEHLDQIDGRKSLDPIDQSNAFMDGLVQCYTSKLSNSTAPCTSMITSRPTIASNTSKLTNSSQSHSSRVTSSLVSSANLQESSSSSPHSSSTFKSATTSTLLPSTMRTPDAKWLQKESKDAVTPPSLTKSVSIAYSPVIKKGKGALTSAMTDVSGTLPNKVNNDRNGNNCPLSSLLIDSVVTAKNLSSTNKTTSFEPEGSHKRHHIDKRGSADMDLASDSVSVSDAKDAVVSLRERLGIDNPFGMKTKQLQQSIASRNVGKNDKAPPRLTGAGVSTSKRAVANQKESVHCVDKRAENQQVCKSATTPVGQKINQGKRYKEPSPFSPMPPYDEMDTPQLKKEVSKIGVRPMNKKRMNMLLKEVYRETHQYETDSDYEPTPMKKQKCINSPPHGVALARSGSQSLPKDVSSASHAAGGEGSSSDPAVKFVDPACPSDDADNDVKEGDDPLSSSQESSNSDVEDLAEESILQGWPEEEEVNPTQMTQSSSETITQRLLAFLRTKDLYEKILMYEPLELDVLKKRLTEAGIKIALAKLMDFLDEQCITFSMKNMSNRNNRPPKGRGRPAKTS